MKKARATSSLVDCAGARVFYRRGHAGTHVPKENLRDEGRGFPFDGRLKSGQGGAAGGKGPRRSAIGDG